MQSYRLYLFEPPARPGDRCARQQPLQGSRKIQAIHEADSHRRGRYAELWRGADLVKIFEPD